MGNVLKVVCLAGEGGGRIEKDTIVGELNAFKFKGQCCPVFRG